MPALEVPLPETQCTHALHNLNTRLEGPDTQETSAANPRAVLCALQSLPHITALRNNGVIGFVLQADLLWVPSQRMLHPSADALTLMGGQLEH